MSESQSSLAALRAEIDRIDDTIHDAIMRRADLVDRIRAAKPAGMPTIRPAREAQILRRLLARHHGRFPRRALAQMWLEMIDAFTWLQGSLRIAAFPGLETIVRDQYGVLAEIALDAEPSNLIADAVNGRVSLAVLPWPQDGQNWWSALALMADRPNVVAVLPPFEARNRAVVVAKLPLEPSGDDRSWIAVPRDRASPFETGRLIARDKDMALFEVDGFVTADDPRMNGLILLGSFASPLTILDIGR